MLISSKTGGNMKNIIITDIAKFNEIQSVEKGITAKVQAHLDDLTKPQGSLGQLEDIVMRYCLITGTAKPIMGKKRVYCFAGDHGVAVEGVSAFPAEVTPQMVMNMLAGGAAINVLTKHADAELVVVDMGVNDPLEDAPSLVRMKVRNGTDNIAVGPAMSMDEVKQAVMSGVELAASASKDGVTLLGTGEMGIANTTPATALYAAYLNCQVEDITGRGTGINDERLQLKIEIIKKSLKVNKDDLTEPLSILAALGGFEIAGICGLILGAALYGIPVVVDGFISTAAATAACAINSNVSDYLFFSHTSNEQGHKKILDKLQIKSILDLGLRLGEGTGAALAMTVIEASIKVYNEMATFSSAAVTGEEE